MLVTALNKLDYLKKGDKLVSNHIFFTTWLINDKHGIKTENLTQNSTIASYRTAKDVFLGNIDTAEAADWIAGSSGLVMTITDN